ncbi:MAG: 50S ribosomal protein L20 [Candidatus Peregrinibacteria bacterium]
MPRVKRGVTTRARHKRLFKLTKGFRGRRRNTVKLAKNAVFKQGQNAYVGRKLKKRVYHRLWVVRLNAACRPLGVNYSRLIYGLELANIRINRKMLADLAVQHPETFKQIVEQAKSVLPAPGQAPDLEALKAKF